MRSTRPKRTSGPSWSPEITRRRGLTRITSAGQRLCDGCPAAGGKSHWVRDRLTARSVRRAVLWGIAAFILTVAHPVGFRAGLAITVAASVAGVFI